MIRITEVVVSRSVKINNGDYQSTDLFLSAKAEADGNGESIDRDEINKIARAVESTMLDWLINVFKQKGKSSSPYAIAKMFGLSLAAKANDNSKAK